MKSIYKIVKATSRICYMNGFTYLYVMFTKEKRSIPLTGCQETDWHCEWSNDTKGTWLKPLWLVHFLLSHSWCWYWASCWELLPLSLDGITVETGPASKIKTQMNFCQFFSYKCVKELTLIHVHKIFIFTNSPFSPSSSVKLQTKRRKTTISYTAITTIRNSGW